MEDILNRVDVYIKELDIWLDEIQAETDRRDAIINNVMSDRIYFISDLYGGIDWSGK